MAAIDVEGVRKRFGETVALDGVDLTVEEGAVYGFLGPNGAGKSTTIDVLLDFVRPDEGQVSVLGMDPREQTREVRQRVGVLPDGYAVRERLTAREHVEFVLDSRGVDADPEAVLERVGIADAADRRAGGYSKGMAQRLALGMALVGEPDLLVLDEPTTGLDPNGARLLRQIVREEAAAGATVFFSSHILGQVEAVCDRVGILQEGRLVAEDTIEGLRESTGAGGLEVVVEGDATAAATAARGVEGVAGVEVEGDTVGVSCRPRAKMSALEAVAATDCAVVDVRPREDSLEDLFADVTGEASGVATTTATAEGEPADSGGERA